MSRYHLIRAFRAGPPDAARLPARPAHQPGTPAAARAVSNRRRAATGIRRPEPLPASLQAARGDDTAGLPARRAWRRGRRRARRARHAAMTVALPPRRGEPATPGAEPGIAGVTGCYREAPPGRRCAGIFPASGAARCRPGLPRGGGAARWLRGCPLARWRAACGRSDVTAAHGYGAGRARAGCPLSCGRGARLARPAAVGTGRARRGLEDLWGGPPRDMAARVQEARDPLGQARAFHKNCLRQAAA